ncbi:MAG: hypothetical protein IJY86_04100 [Clostridia bacterium]|nr:hypothetical protein [Clostridia bacterium]
MSARGKIAFAREAEKLEKGIMGVVNGEKNGFAAVAVGACSRERADGICRELTELLKKYPTAKFSCDFDGARARFDLLGNSAFISGAMGLISFGEEK